MRTTLLASSLILILSACSLPSPQEPGTAVNRRAAAGWGEGSMRLGGAASFFNEDNASAGTDVDTLAFQAEYGFLLREQFEILGQVSYRNRDFGAGVETTDLGLLGGLRYYGVTPTEAAPIALYAEGRAGVVQLDTGPTDDTDLAIGLGGGLVWWPWGFDDNMAWDVSLDWLQSDALEQIGLFVGMSFWW